MSDGQPAASRDMNGCPEFTLKAIREIEALKKVEIYGLGICDFSVKEYYKHNSTVRTPQEIPQRLLELIEKKLLNA
jgi:cobalamin biosynthesis protein CobT